MKILKSCLLVCVLILGPATAAGETLTVGPGKKYAKPSQAIAAAGDGDVVEIESAGNYDGDVARINASNLTLRGVGKGRARLDCKGNDVAGKGIWLQNGDHLTVENIEFAGARCPDRNGAGIRAQAFGLTVRGCRFYDCENGILGGAGEILIEHCEFDHCGHSLNPRRPSHSLYIDSACTKLVFQFNYSTHTLEGHLLKSRAQESHVLYNRLSDENGLGSAVADFPNGGVVVLLGNVLHKGSKAHNSRVIAYGMEGLKHPRNELYVVHNTMLYDHRHMANVFVRVEKTPEDFRPVFRNNLCVGPIPLTNLTQGGCCRQPAPQVRRRGRFRGPRWLRLAPSSRLALPRQGCRAREGRRRLAGAGVPVCPSLQERKTPHERQTGRRGLRIRGPEGKQIGTEE